MYRLDDEERADIREGVAEIERGEVADDEDVKATFDDLRGT
jgi:predicted transcriptional regulator